jgi:hypothetical protein
MSSKIQRRREHPRLVKQTHPISQQNARGQGRGMGVIIAKTNSPADVLHIKYELQTWHCERVRWMRRRHPKLIAHHHGQRIKPREPGYLPHKL